MVKIIKSKKGWIRLVEVFVAILLITGVLLVVISKNSSNNENNKYLEISKKEISILRDIELNDNLREDILGVTPPLEWEDFGSSLEDVKNRILYLTPSNLDCKAKICSIEESCIVSDSSGKSVYAESIIISANLDVYSPRQIKLFCIEE